MSILFIAIWIIDEYIITIWIIKEYIINIWIIDEFIVAGSYGVGLIDIEQLHELECVALPGIARFSFWYAW